MEPAAVLVGALEVHDRRGRPARALRSSTARRARRPSRTRRRGCRSPSERRAAALRAARARRHELRDRAREPGVGALALEERRDVLAERARRRSGSPQLVAEERGDRHAPGALAARCTSRAGSRPCRRCASRPHARHPAARGRSRRARARAGRRRVDGDEPLLGRAEDDRLLAAPAVRVAVRERRRVRAARPAARRCATICGLASKTCLPGPLGHLGGEAARGRRPGASTSRPYFRPVW